MYDFENAACGKERTVKNLFVYLLSLGHLFTDLAPGALPAILPFLVLYNGLSYTEVAGLMFASSCFASLVQPLFGYWADKSMKTWFIPLGIAMSGIGLGGAGFFHSILDDICSCNVHGRWKFYFSSCCGTTCQ